MPDATDFDPVTVAFADLTDERIEELVRDDPRAAEILCARLMGYEVVEIHMTHLANPWYRLHDPKGKREGATHESVDVLWERCAPYFLRNPLVFMPLLEWAAREYGNVGTLTRQPPRPEHHEPAPLEYWANVSDRCGNRFGGKSDRSLVAALVDAVLKAAARREAKKDAE